MESAPAVFAGTTFALFGAALLLWTAVRVLHRAPVAQGADPTRSATLAAIFGVVSLGLGVWCFAQV
ncbi:hypothetical protein OG204_20975 [Streptomyces sp. NBC_01387]|uniref:hypothetical protein n=1 Tax=unclassified Streptomyces TaxID=2593676 RepID=UPI00202454D5|nr:MULTISPECIES: hypothetical protein [unclassified Streptomyces]MCX4549208.1 hypothetical protein [Streptomyces sp. NBC_01500]WSC20779.1 hypothetical protein OIE60_14360 [Streptomyces sp. NBC_01766]WSV54806.1 hypothetical protein OG282_14405 [Streptomyces sp. NBC_01014]